MLKRAVFSKTLQFKLDWEIQTKPGEIQTKTLVIQTTSTTSTNFRKVQTRV